MLDVGNNSLTAASSEVIARLLFQKPAVKDLNLYMNELGNEGMSRIAPALAQCKWVPCRRQGEGAAGQPALA